MDLRKAVDVIVQSFAIVVDISIGEDEVRSRTAVDVVEGAMPAIRHRQRNNAIRFFMGSFLSFLAAYRYMKFEKAALPPVPFVL